MFAAIGADKLPCDARRIDEIAQCRRDILWICPPAQNRAAALRGKVFGVLVRAL